MTGLVRNGDLPEFDQAASGTPAEFKAYLDLASGYTDAKETGYEDGIRQTQVVAYPSMDRDILDSQDPRRLAAVLDCGDVLDQVIACIRLLTIPKSEVNKVGTPMEPDELEALMTRAQRVLSAQLVAHPGLLHPRVFIKTSHFARCERAPIGHVIARSTSIEFPRVSHGISAERLRSFARHHCVRAAFTGAAPKPPDLHRSEKTFHGKTMLQSVGKWLGGPRLNLVLSALELDEQRAYGLPAARRPASLLSSQDKDVRDLLGKCIAASLLAAFNLKTELGGDMRRDPAELVRVLKSTGTSDSDWFMNEVEGLMWHWSALPPQELPAAMRGVAKVLLELQPRLWNGVVDTTVTTPEDPVTERMVVQWLTSATLDTSTERANVIEKGFKSLPKTDMEHKVALLAAIDSVAPKFWRDVQELVERIFKDRLDDDGAAWRSAVLVHTMRRVISSSTVSAAAPAPVVEPSRAPQADLFESVGTGASTAAPSVTAPAHPIRRSRVV